MIYQNYQKKYKKVLQKKTDFNALKTKVDGIDTTTYVLKTKYDTEVGNLKLKIQGVSELLQTSTLNSKITEIENKIPDISNLAVKTKLTTVENKIPDVTNLANKTKLKSVEDKIPSTDGFVKKQILQQK